MLLMVCLLVLTLAHDLFFRQASWISVAAIFIVILGVAELVWYFNERSRRNIEHSGHGGNIIFEKPPKVRLKDMAGAEEAKSELQMAIRYLKDTERFNRLGGRMHKAILLVGANGTGKSVLASAVAGEAQVAICRVRDAVVPGSEWVRELFSRAREGAPCLVFIEKLDCITDQSVKDQLITEIDALDPALGVLLLATTAQLDRVDLSFLQRERIGKQIMIDMPERKSREAILAGLLKATHLEEGVTVEKLAALTAGLSGEDLKYFVNEAFLNASKRWSLKVEENDFNEALSGAPCMKTEEKIRSAYHEMGHVAVTLAMNSKALLRGVSLIPNSIGVSGCAAYRAGSQLKYLDRVALEKKMAEIYGGRAAESLYFDDVSTASSEDIANATEIAHMMVKNFGMSGTLGPVSYESYGLETARAIDIEIAEIADGAFHLALSEIRMHQAFVEAGVRILMENDVVSKEELTALWAKCATEHVRTDRAVYH